MKAAIDLHIHSALSPCSDNDMTPNNIVNMACLKGLDIIAVTDHNSAENVQAVLKCASDKKIIVVPGMEVETREEVHLLCLFPGLDEVMKAQDSVYGAMPDIKNRVDIFGSQLIMNEEDEVIGSLERLLLTAADLGVDDVFEIAKSLGGVAIPAHVDRDSYSIISNLGFIPDNLDIKYVEFSRNCDITGYLARNPFLGEFKHIISSDAHELGSILERESFIDLEEMSIECLIHTLGR